MSIFVFGSNLKGVHGRGAALAALTEHGAEWGVGEGRTGEAYAIPIKETPYKGRGLAKIRASVDRFLDYAEAHPEMEFMVTRVGCGLFGFTDEQMAPMFAGAAENCRFDPAWEKFGLKPWGGEKQYTRSSSQFTVLSHKARQLKAQNRELRTELNTTEGRRGR